MSIRLNHTIVWCRDKKESSAFLVDILGLPEPKPFGPMLVVALGNDVSLDYYDQDGEIAPQHYAFLIGEEDFDHAFSRIREKGLRYWADPGKHRPDELSTEHGGRRLYFDDPDGHLLEIMTRRYDGGTQA